MKITSSEYLESQRKGFALYILKNRAIPAITDGLKASARRVMWIARKSGKIKSASLAGATMPIHPHQAPEGTINTLAAHYGNNIPLLTGIGTFGTLVDAGAFGASRYTSVKISQFAKDVFYTDIEIVPLVDNYDQTQKEPEHFLPLIPISLLNPSEGIAIGFASNILPRAFDDIINSQIAYLKGKNFNEPFPKFKPSNSTAIEKLVDEDTHQAKWLFKGSIDIINSSTIRITNLPYGTSHERIINRLYKLEEQGKIKDIIDNSSNIIDIVVKFQRGHLNKVSEDSIVSQLGLITKLSENLVLTDFDGDKVLTLTFKEVIESFTAWRLKFYVNRYQRLLDILVDDIQKYKDIILSIKENVGSKARKYKSRTDLKTFLEDIGIVNLDYIADLPVYKFTEEERIKIENKLQNALETEKWYNLILSSENERKKIYVSELKEVLKNYNKGVYNKLEE